MYTEVGEQMAEQNILNGNQKHLEQIIGDIKEHNAKKDRLEKLAESVKDISKELDNARKEKQNETDSKIKASTDAICAGYDKSIEADKEKIKTVSAERDKAKMAGVKERISAETASLRAQNDDLKDQINEEMVLRLNVALNTSLAGLAVEQINIAVISALTSNAGEHKELVTDVLQAITEAIASEAQMKIYTSGATNILKYPELSSKENASLLLSTFEEKKPLTNLVNDNETGIQVYIGEETPVEGMKDCSVVTATYELEDGIKGTIGVIGPKRMDYEKVVETLRTVKGQLSDAFKKEDE